MTQGDCDFCGSWSGNLDQGACASCKNRLKLDDPTHPYTRHMAGRVRYALGELYPLPPHPVLARILSEALWQVEQELERGESVNLEHIGPIQKITITAASRDATTTRGAA